MFENDVVPSVKDIRPLYPAWLIVIFIVAAFLAGVVIRWWRTGHLFEP